MKIQKHGKARKLNLARIHDRDPIDTWITIRRPPMARNGITKLFLEAMELIPERLAVKIRVTNHRCLIGLGANL